MPNEFNRKAAERSTRSKSAGSSLTDRSAGAGGAGGAGGRDASGRSNAPRQPRISLAEEIAGLDDELIGLLAKRSRLINKMRGGKTHAATPGAIKSEKQIRSNWEAKAGRISRDGRFIRQLYNLIQDITVQQRDPETPGSAFNLSPVRRPVSMELPGPALASRAMLWIALAASCGKDLRLEGLQRSQGIMDFVKAFSQAGASLSWAGAEERRNGPGSGELRPEAPGGDALRPDPLWPGPLWPDPIWSDALLSGSRRPLAIHGKTIYVGEEPLVFYLLAFLALSEPGKVKFTAGHALKSADLSPLYKLLPDLGARLSFVVPASRGLPASLECSGQLPELYALPADLPLEALAALLLAAFTWKRPLVLSLGSLPGQVAHGALALLEPFFACFPQAAEVRGPEVHYNAWEGPLAETLPPFIQVGMDPVCSAMALSIPFFSGGQVSLVGRWPELPESAACTALLRKAGLKVEIGPKGIQASGNGNLPQTILEGGIVAPDLPDSLLPLFWVLNARIAALAGIQGATGKSGATGQPGGLLLHAVPDKANLGLAADFLSQLGLDLRREESGVRLVPLPREEIAALAAKTHGWSSPGPLWTMAFSLGAFFRANLKISNPDSATDLIPAYWAMYNSLPSPRPHSVAKAEKTPRRRILTNAVLEDTAEREENADPDNPADSLPDDL